MENLAGIYALYKPRWFDKAQEQVALLTHFGGGSCKFAPAVCEKSQKKMTNGLVMCYTDI